MVENKTIRQISKALNISMQTTFDWRHKVLSSFQEIFTRKFKGIVEMDDIYFPFNEKGRKKDFHTFEEERTLRGISNQQVSVMVVSDRYKTIDMKLVKLGRISKQDLERVVPVERFAGNNIICSDKHPSINRFVSDLGLEHKKIKSSARQYVIDRIYHVQNVNNITSKYRLWLRSNFNNVSTKYLQNYLYYFELQQILKGIENKGIVLGKC